MTFKEKQEADVGIVSSAEEPHCERKAMLPSVCDEKPPAPKPAQKAVSEPRRFPIRIDIDRFGILSLLGIMGVLLVALAAPSLDKQERVDAQRWSQFIVADEENYAAQLQRATTTPAQLNALGMKYITAGGVRMDHAKALSYFRKAALSGDPDAKFYLAVFSHTHQPAQRQNDEAIAKAAEDGSIPALEWTYWTQRGPYNDAVKATRHQLITHYQRLAERTGSTEAIWGLLRVSEYENERWLRALEKNAKGGDVLAQYVLGYRYVSARYPQPFELQTIYPRVTGDWRKITDTQSYADNRFLEGLDYLTSAAEAAFGPAELALAYANSTTEGFGVEPLYRQILGPGSWGWSIQTHHRNAVAAVWIKRMAIQDIPAAFNKLVFDAPAAYRETPRQAQEEQANGLRATKNGGSRAWAQMYSNYWRHGERKLAYEAALRSLNSSPETIANDVDNLVLDTPCDVYDMVDKLADVYRRGDVDAGVKRDAVLAAKLKMLLLGSPNHSTDDIIQFLEKCKVSPEQLVKMLEKKDGAEAKLTLARMYITGKGCKADPKRALDILESVLNADLPNQAASGGNVLAEIYFHGQGVPVNYAKAKYYYELSAKHGNAASMLRLGDLYLRGLGGPANKEAAIEWYQKAFDAGADEFTAAARLRELGVNVALPKREYYE